MSIHFPPLLIHFPIEGDNLMGIFENLAFVDQSHFLSNTIFGSHLIIQGPTAIASSLLSYYCETRRIHLDECQL